MCVSGRLPGTKPKRAILYLIWDARGDIADYIPYKLERLRPHADHIVAIVNGSISAAGRAAIAPLVDDVFVRENVGLDVWGYKEALLRIDHRLDDFDEIILMNYTFYGPIGGSFDPLFERMDSLDVDFWGMTDHAAVEPHPILGTGVMHDHIQSHWIAVRRSLFSTEHWREYWHSMPAISKYWESILLHESRFTEHFRSLGYRYSLAYPHQDYPGVDHPAFVCAELLVETGCPVLKRRPFFHDPLYLDKEAIIGRRVLAAAAQKGYPTDLILADMARTAQPKILQTNASLLEILPDVDLGYDASAPFRVAVLAHVFYQEMTSEILAQLSAIPGPFDLYITTTDADKAAHIRRVLSELTDLPIGHSEVRILESNRGRDLSAYFVACRDVLVSSDYDLIVKVHSKRTVQQGIVAGGFFHRQQIDNLLQGRGYTSNVFALFQREQRLGVVFPPMIHIGFPTMGGAWFTNRVPLGELATDLGIRVPLDDSSPLAPFGTMWICRPEALRILAEREWAYEDYQAETDHGDGSLAHVQERIIAYAAGELGYHTRTVANTEYAAISHSFLEYKLDMMSRAYPGQALESVPEILRLVDEAQMIERGGIAHFVRAYMLRFHPKTADRLRPAYQRLRARLRRDAPPDEPVA